MYTNAHTHILVLDYGNTLKKLAVFEDGSLLVCTKTKGSISPIIKDIQSHFPGLKQAIISSVSAVPDTEFQLLQSQFQLFVFNHSTALPFTNAYQTPLTLGLDRLANVAGGIALFPKQNLLIIDAGSCITYDFVDHEGVYLGGAISPGLPLRAKAMHHFTQHLPLIQPAQETTLLGKDTQSCMQSGIIHGTTAEIDGMISAYLSDYKFIKAILSGGDALYFEKRLKNNIFAAPNLVLEGLYHILKHNEF